MMVKRRIHSIFAAAKSHRPPASRVAIQYSKTASPPTPSCRQSTLAGTRNELGELPKSGIKVPR